jgi:hypothetical protein
MIVPVTIGAAEMATKELWKKLEAIPVKQAVESLLKTAILGTSHIIRKVLHTEI